MFNTPYNRKIKDEMMAIDRAYITHSKKVSTKGLLNVSASGNKIGGALPVGMSASIGRPIGGARSGGARSGGKKGKKVGGMESGYNSPDSADEDNDPVAQAALHNQHQINVLNNAPIDVIQQIAQNPAFLNSLPDHLLAIVIHRLETEVNNPDEGVGSGKCGGAKSGGRKPSKWIEHVKAFAAKKGVSYRDALRMPECKESYKKVGSAKSGGARSGGKKGKKVGGMDSDSSDSDNTAPAGPQEQAAQAAFLLQHQINMLTNAPISTLEQMSQDPTWIPSLPLALREIVIRRLQVFRAKSHRGGARSGGKKFKQAGTNIVAKANADLKQSSPPTAATVPPKVGGSTKPTLSAKTQAQLKKEKLKADAGILASELAKLQVAEEDPYMDMSGAKGKAPAVNRATKPKGGAKSGGAKRKPSKWIEHVKAFAAKNGISYRDALRSPECKASYKK